VRAGKKKTVATLQETGRERYRRSLEAAIVVILGGLYGVILTGDYFLYWSPVRGRSLEVLLVALVAVLAVARLSLSFDLWAIVRVRLHWVALGAIVVAGLALRLRVYNFGLPALPGDDGSIVDAAWGMLRTGDYNPHSSSLPSLYVYVEAATYMLRFLWGVSGGLFSKLDMAKAADFYSWGRLITAAFGASTIYIVYLAGRRLYSRSIGLLASFLLAFSWLHAAASNTISPDAPAAFLVVVAAFGFSLIMTEKGLSQRQVTWLYFVCGGAIGLAGAMRLSMLLAAALIPVALVLTRSGGSAVPLAATPAAEVDQKEPDDVSEAAGRHWRRLIVFGLMGIVAGFLAGNPYALLDLPSFLNGLATLMQAHGFVSIIGLRPGMPLREAAGYFSRLDFGLLAAAVVGVALAVWRRRRTDLLVLAFPVIFFFVVASCKGDFSWVLVPLLPFSAILAALAIDQVFGQQGLAGRALWARLGPWASVFPWLASIFLVAVTLVH
jgi:hypothetical protein